MLPLRRLLLLYVIIYLALCYNKVKDCGERDDTMEILLDTHIHTIASGHAHSTVKEYIDEAIKKGLQLICITDHAPALPGAPDPLYFYNLKVIPRKVGGLEILTGVELNIMDKNGKLDLKPSILKKMDITIASLHHPCCLPDTKENNTNAVINTMKNPLVNIVGHLGDPRYEIDIDAVVAVAKETNTIIELNNTSMNPKSTRAGGEHLLIELIKKCDEYGVYISLGSDAHIYTDIGNLGNAIKLIKEVGIKEEIILNTPEKLKFALNKKPKIVQI